MPAPRNIPAANPDIAGHVLVQLLVSLDRSRELHDIRIGIDRCDCFVVGGPGEIAWSPDARQIGFAALFLDLSEQEAPMRILEFVLLVRR